VTIEETKKTVESLPFIEKLLNLKSLLMLWIVMLGGDVGLILGTGDNLLSYPWHNSSVHYGKVGIALGAGVIAYVLLIPFIVYLLNWLWRMLMPKFMQNDDDSSDEHHAAHDRVSMSALYKWAVVNNDKIAFEIWNKREAKNRQLNRDTFEIQIAAATLLLLLVVECNFVPNSLYSVFLSHLGGWVFNITQSLIWGLPILIWWVNTGAVTQADLWVYYPQAVIKKSK
jgi:hypothetical protein